MSEVEALFRLLRQAPPRAAEFVRRVALEQRSVEDVARLYDVEPAQARVLIFRALLDVAGAAPVSDAVEPAAIAHLFADGPGQGEQRALLERFRAHRDPLQALLTKAAADYASSPDRGRDERWRWVAIGAVLALTAFFYWREQHKPCRPQSAAPSSPPQRPEMIAAAPSAVYTRRPMNRLLLAVTAASLVLLACPKDNPGSNLGGSDDEKMDAIAAKLEEYKSMSSADCSQTCSIQGKVCDLSGTACEIAGRASNHADYQKHCVTAQEECARFNEACSTCKK